MSSNQPVRFLITGFNAFEGVPENPTEALMEIIDDKIDEFHSKAEIKTAVFDTSYRKSEEQFLSLFEDFEPHVILSFGVSRRARYLYLERVALNLDDSPRPDNADEIRQGEQINARGPVGYWANLPLEKVYQALEKEEIPARYSHTCGAYVCNHLFYFARDLIEKKHQKAKMAFIHVPLPPEEDEELSPGMELKTVFKAVKIMVETMVREPIFHSS